MKKIVILFLSSLFTAVFLYAQDVTENRPITIPVFTTYSDRFLGNELQYAISKSPSFFFFNAYGEVFEIPKELKSLHNSSASSSSRAAGAMGTMLPINHFLSGMAGIGFAIDSVDMAQSVNFFAGAGLFGHYELWGFGLGLGVLGGYYRDSYKEVPMDDRGYYSGILDNEPGIITNAARFMIVTKIRLPDRVFFLDNFISNIGISGKSFENLFFLDDYISNSGTSGKSKNISLLNKLVFKAIQLGAHKIGINIYYDILKYNLLLEQRLFGAKFETRYLSFDLGYRQFGNSSGKEFANNYQDGMYGRAIVKIWYKNNFPILVSYGFEKTFETKHFLGLGVSFAPDANWINNLHYEFSGIENMRFINSNYTSLERYFR